MESNVQGGESLILLIYIRLSAGTHSSSNVSWPQNSYWNSSVKKSKRLVIPHLKFTVTEILGYHRMPTPDKKQKIACDQCRYLSIARLYPSEAFNH